MQEKNFYAPRKLMYHFIWAPVRPFDTAFSPKCPAQFTKANAFLTNANAFQKTGKTYFLHMHMSANLGPLFNNPTPKVDE